MGGRGEGSGGGWGVQWVGSSASLLPTGQHIADEVLGCIHIHVLHDGVYFRERLGLSMLMWSQAAIHTGLSISIMQTTKYIFSQGTWLMGCGR